MSFISKLLFYVAASSIFLRPFVSNLAFPHEDYLLWLLLAFSATPFVIINKKRIKINRFDLFFLLFGASIVLSLHTSVNKLNSFRHLYLYSGCFIVFYFIRSCNEYQKRIILKTMLFSCFIICLYGIFQYLFGFRYVLELLREQHIVYPFAVEWLNRKRIFATFFSPNAYAGYLTMLAPLWVYVRRIEKDDLSARLFLVMMALCIVNLILTFSLGGIFSILLACLCIVVLKKQKKYIMLSMSIAIFVVLLVLLYWRYQSSSALLNPALSYTHRLLYYKEALSMITRQPWQGIGIGNFEGKLSLFVHNSYLQIWIEMGFAGFVAFISLVGIIMQKGAQRINTQSGLFCAFLVFVIDNLLSFTFFLPETSWLWWVVVGFIAS